MAKLMTTFYTAILATLLITLVGSFANTARADSSRSGLEQKVADLEQKLNEHSANIQSYKMPERIATLEASMIDIKDKVAEITWMIRALVVAVASEFLRRLVVKAGSGKSG